MFARSTTRIRLYVVGDADLPAQAPEAHLGLRTSHRGRHDADLHLGPITGAISYDISADLPDGSHKQFDDLSAAALTYVYFYGIGVFGQRVRANFPSTSGSPTHGPWSTTHDFTRTIPAPANPIASVSKTGLSFSWSPRAEAREYRIQVSKTSDFERPVETVTTDNTVYAPTMTTSGYLAGGAFYWRVAAVDEGRNVGQYSPANRITLRKGMRLSALGAPSAVSG